jgi:hypothetical protein
MPGSGLSLQEGTTVLNDLAADDLIGAAGLEWFFADPMDQLTGTALVGLRRFYSPTPYR